MVAIGRREVGIWLRYEVESGFSFNRDNSTIEAGRGGMGYSQGSLARTGRGMNKLATATPQGIWCRSCIRIWSREVYRLWSY